MKINTYLMFDDKTAEALPFYARCLGGKVEAMMTFGDTPAGDEVPATHRDRIMHGCVMVGDQLIMASDSMSSEPFKGSEGFSVSLNVDTAAEAEQVFNALSEGGQITMPLDRTFWAERFGMLVDAFGVSWMVNYPGDVTPGC